MSKLLLASLGLSALVLGGSIDGAHADDSVRGKMKDAAVVSGDIVDRAIDSKDHTTLVSAVKAAGLVEALKGKGPFTLFAPTNEAFGKLPAGTVEKLLRPESKAVLTSILTYHVVPGNVSAAALTEKIKAEGGNAALTSLQGETLKASIVMNNVILTDAKGATAKVIATDIAGTNGVVHVIDSVIMPK